MLSNEFDFLVVASVGVLEALVSSYKALNLMQRAF
jgi:hypothetical protein